MNLLIEIECEDDGRWIAEVPELPGVMVYAHRCFSFPHRSHSGGVSASHLVRLLIWREETVQPSSVELVAYLPV